LRQLVLGPRRRDVLAVLLRPLGIHSGKGLSHSIVDGARRLGVAPGERTTPAVPDGPDALAGLIALPLLTTMSVIRTAAGAPGH
jgi:hypothetical protein